MRVLRIYQKLPPNMGGMEKHILNLTQEQISQGIEVVVAFCDGDAITQSDIKVNMFPFHRLKPQFLSNVLFYITLIITLLVRREKFDIIHIHGDWSAFLFSRLIKKVVQAQSVLGSFHGKIDKQKFPFVRRTYNLLGAIYVTGREEFSYLKGRINIPVYWVHSGVSECFFEEYEGNEKVDVLTVANCVPVKNIDLLLDIALGLPNKKFVHIGGGDFQGYKNKAIVMGVDNIEFRGNQTPSEIAQAMQLSSIFLLTSFEEGTPTVILEALVKKCFIISSNCCDLTQILNSSDGKVIDGFNAVKYINEIKSFSENNKFVYEARFDNSINFSWKSVAKKITAIKVSLLHK